MASFHLKMCTKILLCLLFVGKCVCTFQPIKPLHFTQMAENAGLPVEQYEVITEDGYILDIFRVPGDESRPVLLLSGAFGTADDYILLENTSLPYTLARNGSDIWLGNVRGCKYGLRHTTLNKNMDKFWNFTFHEYAVYDTAAMIDFVLNKTQQRQLTGIAWSLGTTSFYILGTVRPEYISKVKVVISFAPICYLHHSPAFSALALPGSILDPILKLAGVNVIFGENSTEINLIRHVCASPTIAYDVCLQISFLVYGFDSREIVPELASKIFRHYPSSMSEKTLSHLLQVVRSKQFKNYNYGTIGNIKMYGHPIIEEYELSKNNMSVVLISGKNDQTSTLEDVELLKEKLPNIEDHIILEDEKFNHIDFVYGINTQQKLYETIVLDLLNKYT